MAVPLLINARYEELVMWLSAVALVDYVIWLCLTKGSYIAIDYENKIIRSSYFLVSRKACFSQILAIKSIKIFGGSMTELFLQYKDLQGRDKSIRLLGREFIAEPDFIKFTESLKRINPSLKIM